MAWRHEMVPRITSLNLPSQMLSIKNKLMPIGGEICASSTNNMEHDAEHDQVDADTYPPILQGKMI